MLKLLDVWKAAAGSNPNAPRACSSAGLMLTEADLGLHDEDFDADDPDVPEFIREEKRARQHEKQAAVEVDLKQRQLAHRKEHDQEDRERRLRAWLASEQYRRAIQELTADISDARQAATWARSHAIQEKQQADESFENARGNSVLLADGRHVYFTRDGTRLYGEDDRQITDLDAVAEARHQRQARPDATTYEGFVERRKARDQAAEKVEHLQKAIGRLDDLDDRIKKGNLTPEELAQARKEKEDIVNTLPPDARADYEERKGARNRPEREYKSAADLFDGSFPTAPDASRQFSNAASGQAGPPQASAHQSAQRPGHEDTGDYRPGF